MLALNTEKAIKIEPFSEAFRDWARNMLKERWGSSKIVTRGNIRQADALPGFVAIIDDQPQGLITYSIDPNGCEVISLDSLVESRGIGTALLKAVKSVAASSGIRRIWLITTNDNTPALRFYQKKGFEIVAVHRYAVTESRKVKPGIPDVGIDGIPIRDEIELELRVC